MYTEAKVKEDTIRLNKGRNLFLFSENYVVFDIETTGLDAKENEIIEISALKVKEDKVIDTFSTLVHPNATIDPFISSLTGITNDMVKNAPTVEEVLPLFIEFIGDSILMGHNVNFDINFVYDHLVKIGIIEGIKNDFIDTMRLGRKIVKEKKHHRLKDLADYYSISYEGAHRSLNDCYITYHAYLKMKEQVVTEYGTFDNFYKKETRNYYNIVASNIMPTTDVFDETHPLYHKKIAITGTLKMPRKEAMQQIVDVGGIVEDTISVETDYLIVGKENAFMKGKKSSKIKKAEAMIEAGYKIRLMSEEEFYTIVVKETVE